MRFLYGRSLISTGTTVQLAGYRYSTEGYHTLQETATKRMTGWLNDSDEVDASGRPVGPRWTSYYNLYNSRRERIELNLSQTLGESSSLYATGTHQTYWHNNTVTDALQAGFSTTYHSLSWTLSYGYSRNSDQPRADRTYFVSLSVPLDALLSHDSGHNAWVNYSVRRDSDGTMTQQAGLSGTALRENNLNWGSHRVTAGRTGAAATSAWPGREPMATSRQVTATRQITGRFATGYQAALSPTAED